MTEPFSPGSVALITGAAGAIGRSVALRLAAAGALVALADLPSATEGLEETASQCSQVSPGSSPVVVPFDVTDDEAIDAAVEELVATVGCPSMVFNNAGYQGQFAKVADYDRADMRRVLSVNVAGVFSVLQASARAMEAAGQAGSIVNMASMAGVSGAPNMAAYSASKAAVIGLTKAAAKDLAPSRIRVNSVSPGFIGPGPMWDRQVAEQARVDSPYYGDSVDEVADQMVNMVPLGRYGSLEEVAEVVLFLLGENSSFVNAVNVEISGGGA